MQLAYAAKRLENELPTAPQVPGITDTKGEVPTVEEGPEAPASPPVLAFSFDFSLSADDLKKLKPDQIAAMFEAVGKVMAIKAGAGIE